MTAPRTLAERLERDPTVPAGAGERFDGYAVIAAPFRSGHLLAMRRFPASSLGAPYTSVWHRAPSGAWTIWTDRDPLEACPRYFGSALQRSETVPIDLTWHGPRAYSIHLPGVGLHWDIHLRATAVTRIMNTAGGLMPDRMWHSRRMMSLMGAIAGPLLRAGKVRLHGAVPNGQRFLANPRLLWALDRSEASLGGADLGPPAPLDVQLRLGDFWIPQTGLFAFGQSYFETSDPARHQIVASRGGQT